MFELTVGMKVIYCIFGAVVVLTCWAFLGFFGDMFKAGKDTPKDKNSKTP
jgi:hypothetical protein